MPAGWIVEYSATVCISLNMNSVKAFRELQKVTRGKSRNNCGGGGGGVLWELGEVIHRGDHTLGGLTHGRVSSCSAVVPKLKHKIWEMANFT